MIDEADDNGDDGCGDDEEAVAGCSRADVSVVVKVGAVNEANGVVRVE